MPLRHLAMSLAIAFSTVSAAPVIAETLTDVTGRRVDVKLPVQKVILGEGRQVYLLAALDTENPFKRVVGWRSDFSQADPDNYAIYLEKFPEMEHDDPNAVRLEPGEEAEIIWTFGEAGTFEFACLLPGHYEAGMHGPIIIN